MYDRSVVFLDLETTGATATHDRVTEVGLVEVDNGRFVREWSTLVNPGMSIPPAIQALTGISNDMVALAPHFEEFISVTNLLRKAARKLVRTAKSGGYSRASLRYTISKVDELIGDLQACKDYLIALE